MAHVDEAGTPRRKRPYVLTGLAVAGALLAVAGVFGGFRSQPKGPAAVKPGAVVHQGLFDVQVQDARTGRIKLGEYDPVRNLLLVRMRVTVLGDRSYGVSSFMDGAVAVPSPGKFLQADFMGSQALVDGHITSELHPHLPVTVQLVWPLGDGTRLSEVTLALREWSYGQGFTDDDFYWSVTKQSPVKANVTIPVRQGATS